MGQEVRKECLMDTEPSTKHRGHTGVSLIHEELRLSSLKSREVQPAAYCAHRLHGFCSRACRWRTSCRFPSLSTALTWLGGSTRCLTQSRDLSVSPKAECFGAGGGCEVPCLALGPASTTGRGVAAPESFQRRVCQFL